MRYSIFYTKVVAVALVLEIGNLSASTCLEKGENSSTIQRPASVLAQEEKDAVLLSPTHSVKVSEEVYGSITSCYDLLKEVYILSNQQDSTPHPLTQAFFDQAYSAHCKVYAGQKETVTGEEKEALTFLFIVTESLLQWQGLGSVQCVSQGIYEDNSYTYQPAEMGRIMAAFSQENIERMRLETPPSKNCETFMEAVKQIVFLQGDTLDEDPQEELPLSFFLTQGSMMGHSLVSLFE